MNPAPIRTQARRCCSRDGGPCWRQMAGPWLSPPAAPPLPHRPGRAPPHPGGLFRSQVRPPCRRDGRAMTVTSSELPSFYHTGPPPAQGKARSRVVPALAVIVQQPPLSLESLPGIDPGSPLGHVACASAHAHQGHSTSK